MFTIAYCCYANEDYIEYNLKNHYDYADEIIISYGPFQGYPEFREKMGLEPQDNTLDKIKNFISNEDKENKIQLIIQKDGFKNFTDSRNSWIKHINTPFFVSLDCDEIYYKKDMKLAKELMQKYLNEDINMIYCNRRSFALDKSHHYENSWQPRLFSHTNGEMGEFIESVKGTPQFPQTARFKNGIGVFPENGFDLFSVVAYKNKSNMKWAENSIDSILVDGNRNSYFSDTAKIVYEPKIRYNHYAACGWEKEFFAKQLYYHKVRGAVNSEEEINAKIEYYQDKIKNNPYALMVWFENNPGVGLTRFNQKHPDIFYDKNGNLIDIDGEHKDRREADKVCDLNYEERKEMHTKYSI